jgi:hypothetical protein
MFKLTKKAVKELVNEIKEGFEYAEYELIECYGLNLREAVKVENFEVQINILQEMKRKLTEIKDTYTWHKPEYLEVAQEIVNKLESIIDNLFDTLEESTNGEVTMEETARPTFEEMAAEKKAAGDVRKAITRLEELFKKNNTGEELQPTLTEISDKLRTRIIELKEEMDVAELQLLIF